MTHFQRKLKLISLTQPLRVSPEHNWLRHDRIRAFASLTWWYRRAVDSSSWTVAKSDLGWLKTTSAVFMKYWLKQQKNVPSFPPNSLPQIFWESADQIFHILVDRLQWGSSLSHRFNKISSSRKTTSFLWTECWNSFGEVCNETVIEGTTLISKDVPLKLSYMWRELVADTTYGVVSTVSLQQLYKTT
jgi:hypothetical protein